MNDKMDKEIILYNQAAVYEERTIKGWWNGKRYWGNDKHMARWDGCTHLLCKECGENIHEKRWTCCAKCRAKHTSDRYYSLPVVDWDGETPICEFDGDHFFFSHDELDDYCFFHECDKKDLMLVICEPVYLSTIDDDHWHDDLPEDGELSDEIAKALDELNNAIREYGPVSWEPGKKRISWE